MHATTTILVPETSRPALVHQLSANLPTHKPKTMPPTHVIAALAIGVLTLLAGVRSPVAEDTWRGIRLAPEHRCTPFNRSAYPYPQSIERRIIERMGGRIYGPYEGRHFRSARETDIEHIIAVSEAHDSGLCNADPTTRTRFARDLLNLTLASPEINRCGAGGKCGFDAAEWLPPRNRCWYAGRIVDVRRKYNLTIDRREAQVLESVLSRCPVLGMVVYRATTTQGAPPRATPVAPAAVLAQWDDNQNGHISCAEARRHRIAPVPRSHPAYPFMSDRDGDGVVCE